MHPSRLRRELERSRKNMGLPLSRIAIRPFREGDKWACGGRPPGERPQGCLIATVAELQVVEYGAIWKGGLKVGSTTIPVKLYAAVQDRDVRFHVLQNKTKSRVKQQMVTEDKEEVEKPQIRKGYEIESGRFVIVDAQELQ